MSRSWWSLLGSLRHLTDEQAMWRVQTQDDAQAFAELVARWQGKIEDMCARMIGDAHRAEDLAQEVFARIFARRKTYQPSARFSTYLWRVALNHCYDELRRQQRQRQVFAAVDFAEAPEASASEAADGAQPDQQAELSESGALVRAALLRLPEIYRSVLVLRHYEDLKFRQIAEVLDVPEGTVKSRMAEALAQLSRELTPLLAEATSRNKSADSMKELCVL